MPRGRRTAYRLTLAPDQAQLLSLVLHVRSPASTPQLRQRAWIILALAQGQTITAIARQVGLARRHVYKWIWRWQAEGLKGLRDRPSGYPKGQRQGRQEAGT